MRTFASQRGRSAAAIAGALLVFAATSSAHAASDPYLEYYTLETPHFRIHYAKNIEPIAEYVADTAEEVNARLSPALGWQPTEITEIVLTDNTESANGSATALPYDTIRLFVTAPDDMSPLSEYDDWDIELVTHEYTHILHTDHITGLPAILNAVLGRTFAPNQVQPRWVLEGLAVLEESKHTSGGRNRSSIFDMYLRANVIEDNLATLDQISHTPRAWPGGNFWYLYGSRFLTWIADTYGDHTMRTIAADYGNNIIPYGINRSIRRATGSTYEELYEGWKSSLKRLYGEQITDAKSLPGGLREGTRLTHHGRTTQRPRWIPQAARLDPKIPEVLYYLEDGHHRDGFYRMPVLSAKEAWESDRDLFIRASGDVSASFDAKGAVLFSNIEIHKRIYPFSDLLKLPPNVASTSGDEPERVRLTDGLRAINPDISPDGRRVTFAVNRRGTQYLSIADMTPEGTIGPSRVLVPSVRFQQAYTPRFSPDGRRIAYSSWMRGGYRDIRVVDATTGDVLEEVTHDRALDIQPSWSPDGGTIYFTSDRTGIPNVFAYDLAAHELWQVTNVRTGAFDPEVSPDGTTLIYAGYTSQGFDLYGLPIDRSTWHKAQPYTVSRPDPLPPPPKHEWPRHAYDPLPTLRPHSWTGMYGPGTFGQTLTISTTGADVVGFHAFDASVSVDTVRGDPQFTIDYTYGRLPFDLSMSLFRTVTPRAGYQINSTQPAFVEQYLGLSNSLSYSIPRAFDSFNFLLAYTASRFDARLPVGSRLDPQEQIVSDPVGLGYLGLVRAGVAYSNVESYLYSVSASRGTSAQIYLDVAGKGTASDYDLYTIGYAITNYQQMPWHADHSLALHVEGAVEGGNYPRSGLFYTGGFVDIPLSDAIENSIFQGGFVLRGYAPYSYSGRQYHLANAEYRFPIVYPEHGLSTLPAFLNRISGAVFTDYGGAFDTLDLDHWRSQFHTSFGGELLVDTTFGYFVGTTSRFGYAKGLSQEAYPGGQFYFVISSEYLGSRAAPIA